MLVRLIEIDSTKASSKKKRIQIKRLNEAIDSNGQIEHKRRRKENEIKTK